jgi:transposase
VVPQATPHNATVAKVQQRALTTKPMCGSGRPSAWLSGLIARKPPKLAAVALANKTARIAWKLMVSGERYQRAAA